MSGKVKFIVEITSCLSTGVCLSDGSEIDDKSEIWSDLADCCSGGDCQEACQYVLSKYDIDFRIVARIDGKYRNVAADRSHKKTFCGGVYFESETDFADEGMADMYIVWEAASALMNC